MNSELFPIFRNDHRCRSAVENTTLVLQTSVLEDLIAPFNCVRLCYLDCRYSV